MTISRFAPRIAARYWRSMSLRCSLLSVRNTKIALLVPMSLDDSCLEVTPLRRFKVEGFLEPQGSVYKRFVLLLDKTVYFFRLGDPLCAPHNLVLPRRQRTANDRR